MILHNLFYNADKVYLKISINYNIIYENNIIIWNY